MAYYTLLARTIGTSQPYASQFGGYTYEEVKFERDSMRGSDRRNNLPAQEYRILKTESDLQYAIDEAINEANEQLGL